MDTGSNAVQTVVEITSGVHSCGLNFSPPSDNLPIYHGIIRLEGEGRLWPIALFWDLLGVKLSGWRDGEGLGPRYSEVRITFAWQKLFSSVDSLEWEDRIAQAVNFVGAGGPTRLQEFLLDLAAQEREEYYLDQYGKISEKPDMILLEVEVLKAERQDRREEEAQQVDLAEGDINEYEKEEMDDDQSALFAHRPDSLNLDEEVFHDLKTGDGT
eukprot:s1647_g7.t1